MLADLANPKVTCLWYLLICWKLDNMMRQTDVRKTISRLNKIAPNNLISTGKIVPFLISALYEKYEVHGLLNYISPSDIYQVCEYFFKDNKFDSALKISAYLKDPYLKQEALSEIAQMVVSANDKDKAKKILEEAVSLVDGINVGVDKIKGLSRIAQALGCIGDKLRADKLLEQAISLVDTLKDGKEKKDALFRIAEALASIDTKRAISVANRISYFKDRLS